MYKDFFKLFEGDPAKYITSTLIGVEDNRGKKEATYTTVHEAVTPAIWKDHLDGKIKIFWTSLIGDQFFKNKNKCSPPDLDLTGTKGNLYSLNISTYFFSL